MLTMRAGSNVRKGKGRNTLFNILYQNAELGSVVQ